ncbi:glycosyltransferase [Thermotalea metallivorans]|uniref:Glycosyltransferase 2-like domain-containing protein n=1 Tax=Thermotalea metallivorans TaxID=520762 RepID=A0A140L1I5_9FIRM|nr:glycosyltransferase family 2 protein [Thermotalea metallivorans]KXG74410.1 hypothetical protein AN619_23930 [Thermotalea metallivorans]
MEKKVRVLVGSPVRQRPEILREFLTSLASLHKEGLEIHFYFVDDNDCRESTLLLENFYKVVDGTVKIQAGERIDTYVCNEETHHWKEHLIWKVAAYKNAMIKYCMDQDYDYLFLVDSDIVLHPKTLKHLVETEKDIIAEVFWTKWYPDSPELPQVWLQDQYTLTEEIKGRGSVQDRESAKDLRFLEKLKQPGVYAVGGLGACTLISRKALKAGVNYNKIYNISFWGEDRHFCIRAAALGFQLYADTHYPPYHIYRQQDLEGVEAYKKQFEGNENRKWVAWHRPMADTKEVIDVIKDFVISYLSCDYRIATGFEGLAHVSSSYARKLFARQKEILDYQIKHGLVCEALPLDVDVSRFDPISGKAEANLSFALKIKGKEKMERRFTANLHLVHADQKKWIVEFMAFKNDRGESLLGFSLIDLLEEKIRIDKDRNNKLTLAMLVRNEANKFLKQTLTHAARYIDKAIILDDGSTDNTVQVCRETLKRIPLKIISNGQSNFHNEILLRKQLWDLTVATRPDWILCLDADEIFEDRIIDHIDQLMNQSSFDYYGFRLYDLWDETHYREDAYWQAHFHYKIFFIRYQPNYQYTWHETPQHCGRFPNNIHLLNGCDCHIRLKHYGWANEALRLEKYKRYMTLDPEGKYGDIRQYQSILDERPRLIKFEERE